MDYKIEFVNFPKCYEDCNSYCCRGFNNEHFKMIKYDFVAIPLLEKEFLEYKKSGGIKGLEEPKKIEVFKLRGGQIIKIFWLQCHLKGLCNPHSNRPLMCKVYPLMPKVNNKGEIKDFLPATFFDLFFDDTTHPCTLVAKSKEDVKRQLNTSLAPLLSDPLYIFAFRACEVLAKYLKDELIKDFGSHFISNIPKEQISKFWQKVEMLLLFRKAWRNEKFYNEISDIHDEIAAIWGEFLAFE